jgi:hypothetical protein
VTRWKKVIMGLDPGGTQIIAGTDAGAEYRPAPRRRLAAPSGTGPR